MLRKAAQKAVRNASKHGGRRDGCSRGGDGITRVTSYDALQYNYMHSIQKVIARRGEDLSACQRAAVGRGVWVGGRRRSCAAVSPGPRELCRSETFEETS